jgi:hypothetical protein
MKKIFLAMAIAIVTGTAGTKYPKEPETEY